MSLRLIKIFIFLFVIILFGACGQKGKLYLPDEKQVSLVSCVHIV